MTETKEIVILELKDAEDSSLSTINATIDNVGVGVLRVRYLKYSNTLKAFDLTTEEGYPKKKIARALINHFHEMGKTLGCVGGYVRLADHEEDDIKSYEENGFDKSSVTLRIDF